jgi:SAM-dependent methyltransferase
MAEYLNTTKLPFALPSGQSTHERIVCMDKEDAALAKCAVNATEAKGAKVSPDPAYGFYHLDPIPPDSDISDFYESRYYDLVRKGNRAPELRRIMEGGDPASREVRWLRDGLYTDIIAILQQVTDGRKLFEVGCGTGDFLSFAVENGFNVVGTEPSKEAAQRAVSRNLNVRNLSLEKFAAQCGDDKYDVIVLINVLEHVPNAIGTLQECKRLLTPNGIICIRVPNDFSELQAAAKEKLRSDPWWIAVPDHINYFNFASLRNVFDRLGFDTVYAQGDFPMELFLLMGENYIGSPEIGSSCHSRRVQFDLGVPGELRRKLYSALASAGVGRDCLVFGKRNRP